jgi:hypothetical protein
MRFNGQDYKKKKRGQFPSNVKSFFIRPLLKMRFANGFEKGSGQTCIQQTRLKTNKGWKTTWTQKSKR